MLTLIWVKALLRYEAEFKQQLKSRRKLIILPEEKIT
jgi:hypothetical protein